MSSFCFLLVYFLYLWEMKAITRNEKKGHDKESCLLYPILCQNPTQMIIFHIFGEETIGEGITANWMWINNAEVGLFSEMRSIPGFAQDLPNLTERAINCSPDLGTTRFAVILKYFMAICTNWSNLLLRQMSQKQISCQDFWRILGFYRIWISGKLGSVRFDWNDGRRLHQTK